MAHVTYRDRIEMLLLADDADDMLDIVVAAGRVDDAAIEVLPSRTEEDRFASAGESMDFAVDFNRQLRSEILDPREQFGVAKDKMDAGGYVVRLAMYDGEERSALDGLPMFWNELVNVRAGASPAVSDALSHTVQ